MSAVERQKTESYKDADWSVIGCRLREVSNQSRQTLDNPEEKWKDLFFCFGEKCFWDD